MPRQYTLESFGVSYGIATEAFITSGKEELAIPFEKVGQAVNARMRFNMYWKLLRKLPESEVPPGLRQYLNDLAQLCTLADKNRPTVVILARRDKRVMDEQILKAVEGMNGPSARDQALVAKSEQNAVLDPTEEALRKAGMIK